jgi:hypothetical protein
VRDETEFVAIGGSGDGKPEEASAAVFLAGDKEDSIAETAPGVRFWAAVVGPQDDADTGFLRGGENFGARAFGMVGIFGMNVDDSAIIFVGAEIGESLAFTGKLETRVVDCLELGWVKSLLGGAALLGLRGGDCQRENDDEEANRSQKTPPSEEAARKRRWGIHGEEDSRRDIKSESRFWDFEALDQPLDWI